MYILSRPYDCQYRASLRAGRSGDRISAGGWVRSSAPFQTCPGAHPPSYKMVTGSLSWGVKRPGRGVNHPPLSTAEIKERVELYLYSPPASSWLVLGRTVGLPYTAVPQFGKPTCHKSQASAAVQLNSSVFWLSTDRDTSALKTGPIGCPETSVLNQLIISTNTTASRPKQNPCKQTNNVDNWTPVLKSLESEYKYWSSLSDDGNNLETDAKRHETAPRYSIVL